MRLMETGLVWGVKESFLAYLRRHGDVSPGPGAGFVKSGELYFALQSASLPDDRTPCGQIRFTGAVRFLAHFGMLSLEIADPTIVIDAGTATLSLVAVQGAQRELVDFADLAFPAVAGRPEGVLALPPIAATLLPGGAALLGDAYPIGEALAPLHIRV